MAENTTMQLNPPYEYVDVEKPTSVSAKYSTVCAATMNNENIYSEARAAVTNTTSIGKSNKVKIDAKCKSLVFFVAIVTGISILMVTFSCFVALFVEIANLKSKTASHQQILAGPQALLLTQQNTSLADITQQLSTLRNQTQELSDSIAMFDHEFLLVQNTSKFLLRVTLGQHFLNPVPTCAALPSSSPSGYYSVRTSNGSAVRVYCDMTRSCGNGVTGGWMRVVELDMTNNSHQCPSGLRQHTESSISVHA